jgi:hypothetical protein
MTPKHALGEVVCETTSLSRDLHLVSSLPKALPSYVGTYMSTARVALEEPAGAAPPAVGDGVGLVVLLALTDRDGVGLAVPLACRCRLCQALRMGWGCPSCYLQLQG